MKRADGDVRTGPFCSFNELVNEPVVNLIVSVCKGYVIERSKGLNSGKRIVSGGSLSCVLLVYCDNPGVCCCALIKNCARFIGGAVVNCKDGEVGICLRQNRIKAFAEIRSDVVDRDDDCYFWLVINVCILYGGGVARWKRISQKSLDGMLFNVWF